VCAANVTIISLPYYVKDNQMSARYPDSHPYQTGKAVEKRAPFLIKRAKNFAKRVPTLK
jgi:hypothetical protein